MPVSAGSGPFWNRANKPALRGSAGRGHAAIPFESRTHCLRNEWTPREGYARRKSNDPSFGNGHRIMKQTFLHPQHVQLGARMVDFHGWELPVQYTGILAEHGQCRRAAALFDTCHMGQFLVEGAGAGSDLGRLLTFDAAGMPVGKCRYGFLLNEEAGILDDVIAARLAEDQYLVVVNADTAAADFEWINKHRSAQTALTNRSAAWGKLDVQGPASYRVLADSVGFDLASLKYFSARRGTCLGRDAVISRTGYTGELGYEIFMPGDALVKVFQYLLELEETAPAGLGARDLLRMEMNYPLYGTDIHENCNPVEADLDRFIARDREFIGAASLRRIDARGVQRKLAAFVCDTRRRPQTGSDICCDGQRAGKVTSGAYSPSLGKAIGMGYVATGCAAPGTALEIRTARTNVHAIVREKPLYRGGSCRIKTTELKNE